MVEPCRTIEPKRRPASDGGRLCYLCRVVISDLVAASPCRMAPRRHDRRSSSHARHGMRLRYWMDIDRLMSRLNPLIAWLLRSPMHALLSGGLMLVQVTGRRTGRRYWIPVGYQRDGTALTVLVSHARRKQWWRNYRDRRPIDVWLRGRAQHGQAMAVVSRSPAFRDAIERTLSRVPGLGRQFGIAYDRRIGLTDAQLAVVAHAAVVVRIDLDG